MSIFQQMSKLLWNISRLIENTQVSRSYKFVLINKVLLKNSKYAHLLHNWPFTLRSTDSDGWIFKITGNFKPNIWMNWISINTADGIANHHDNKTKIWDCSSTAHSKQDRLLCCNLHTSARTKLPLLPCSLLLLRWQKIHQYIGISQGGV